MHGIENGTWSASLVHTTGGTMSKQSAALKPSSNPQGGPRAAPRRRAKPSNAPANDHTPWQPPRPMALSAEALLAEAAGKTKRQVQEMVARLAPKPDLPDTIECLSADDGSADAYSYASPPPIPLSPNRYKVQLMASTELRDKLEQAQALMRHRN